MQIKYVDIQNFRKLKKCEIEISNQQTIFVGANNSGKTSAIIAMQYFLKRKKLSGTDISLANWDSINLIGKKWVDKEAADIDLVADEEVLRTLLPTLDVWITVNASEYYHFQGSLSSIGAFGEIVGFRTIYTPEKLEEFYVDFIEQKRKVKLIEDQIEASDQKRPKLWPTNLKDFIEEKINDYFAFKTYALNSAIIEEVPTGNRYQLLPVQAAALKKELLSKIIKVSMIPASRGFDDSSEKKIGSGGKLSNQLQDYYNNFLNPTDKLNDQDAKAVMAIMNAKDTFDEELKRSFKTSFKELENVGYPGVSSPRLVLSSKVEPVTSLNHKSAVQYEIDRYQKDDTIEPYRLPEQHNGLGYQNLISMVFHLIRFRDEWIQKVKDGVSEDDGHPMKIEPIHLILIEEPEAHLHSQVQQVFIRKAVEILGNDDWLKSHVDYASQLILSTHSGDIAHEVDFADLRYFERMEVTDDAKVPVVKVRNLSEVFGTEDETVRFVKRYLKSTHCDLFFADGIITVEGAAERMLLPQFIKNNYIELSTSYISILEIGGAHAHRLRSLIELLNIPTLIITDLDAAEKNSNSRYQKAIPKREEEQRTTNATLMTWIPEEKNIDKLLNMNGSDKVKGIIRVAFQT